MSAINERQRRVTAGKRINFLAGQELEQDEAFWGHDTWQEDSDSFHSSDVASNEDLDEFDSDFDLSENDQENTEFEEQIGAAAERDIAIEERELKKRSGAYVDTAKKKGLPVARGKKGAGRRGPGAAGAGSIGKRVVGDGLNAGIVLNVPLIYQIHHDSPRSSAALSSSALAVPQDSTLSSVALQAPTIVTSDSTAASPTLIVSQPAVIPRPQPVKKVKENRPTLAATRVRRKIDKAATDSTYVVNSRKSVAKETAALSNQMKRGKQSFTQEQMLIEAVQATEPENERWILGRKRIQAEKNDLEQFLVRNSNMDKHGKVVEKFVSRHGYLNTITFPDMDHLPDIIQQMTIPSPPMPVVEKPVCAITGKLAKYRDPKSGLGYFDIAAYRELRRRYEANELNLDPIEVTVQNEFTPKGEHEAWISEVGLKRKSENVSSTGKPSTAGTKRKAVERKPRPAKKKIIEATYLDQNGCELTVKPSISNGISAEDHKDHTEKERCPVPNSTSGSDETKRPPSPPLSPGRKSPRNRKPTSKVLESVLSRSIPSFASLPSQMENSLSTVVAASASAKAPLENGNET